MVCASLYIVCIYTGVRHTVSLIIIFLSESERNKKVSTRPTWFNHRRQQCVVYISWREIWPFIKCHRCSRASINILTGDTLILLVTRFRYCASLSVDITSVHEHSSAVVSLSWAQVHFSLKFVCSIWCLSVVVIFVVTIGGKGQSVLWRAASHRRSIVNLTSHVSSSWWLYSYV